MGIGSAPMGGRQAAVRRGVSPSPLEQNKQNSFLIIELVQKMVQRKSFDALRRGPDRHRPGHRRGGQRKGLDAAAGIDAGISLNLGIFNLLPIPILDGGMILFLSSKASCGATSACA